MQVPNDMIGRTFGRLRVIARADSYRGRARWTCECQCGRSNVVATTVLRNGRTRSCGCLVRDSLRQKVLARWEREREAWVAKARATVRLLDDGTAMFEVERPSDGTAVFVRVDQSDLRRVLDAGPWFAHRSHNTWYVVRHAPRGEAAALHRFVLGLPPGRDREVDHRSGCGADNRKENLRIVSRAEQAQNVRKREGMTSRYRGVCWVADKRKWRAQAGHLGVHHHLGMFDSEIKAARAAADARAKFFTHAVESRHPVPPASEG